MTASEDKDVASEAIESKKVQLCKLPNLDEVPHANSMEQLFAQAVLLQFKCLNKDVSISQLAFDDLCYITLLQLDDLLQGLKKITQVQRRTKISKHDLELYFKGVDMDLSALNEQVDISNHIHKTFPKETQKLNENVDKVMSKFMTELEETELLSSKHSEFFVQDVDILNLLSTSKKSNKCFPDWLPELPPDHTYKFTSLYKRPITDERVMKEKLLEEGLRSEKALIKMLNEAGVNEDPLSEQDNIALTDQLNESQLETELIYGLDENKSSKKEELESFKPLPLKNFDVSEYCLKRQNILKRRAERLESKTLNRKRNPFIRAATICSPYGQGSIKSRKSVENQLKTMLKRSYVGLIHSIPKLKEEREKARKEAEEKERQLQEQRRLEKEKKMTEQEVLDLNNLQNDPLIGWDNDDSDDDDDDNIQFDDVKQNTPQNSSSTLGAEQHTKQQSEEPATDASELPSSQLIEEQKDAKLNHWPSESAPSLTPTQMADESSQPDVENDTHQEGETPNEKEQSSIPSQVGS